MNASTPSSRRTFLIIGSTIAGSVFAFLVLPSLFFALPNELIRSRFLLEALRSTDSPTSEIVAPEIVVLGNSIAMNGIDAKQLRSELAGDSVVWNLSSAGQQIIETMFLADELPKTTKTVLILTFTSDLIRDASEIPHDKMIAYLQYGYHPSEATREALRKLGSPETARLLGLPQWRVALESRWSVRSAIDISSRSLLRKDLNLTKAATSLFYPSPYTQQLSQEAIAVMVARTYSQRRAEQGRLGKSAAELLTVLLAELDKRGIRVAIAMLPEHSELRQRTDGVFYEDILAELRQLASETDTPVFSFLTLLEDTHFVDCIHPNGEGAQKLTSALASEVTRWQSQRED